MSKLNNFSKKIDNRFKDFLYKNEKIRNARGFFHSRIKPYLAKGFLTIITLAIFVFLALKIFKPDLLLRIENKITHEFKSYLKLNDYQSSTIKITGLKRISDERIVAIIQKTHQKFADENQESLLKIFADEILKNEKWIKEVRVFRTLPNRLNIEAKEYAPFAIWQNDSKKYVIDNEGNKIEIDNDDEFDHLIILSGRNANLQASTLFNILATNPEISEKIYFASWVGNRRWNIGFENGILAKLPEGNIDEAWQKLIEIYNTNGALHNLKIIDLRIDKKTYLEYSKSP